MYHSITFDGKNTYSDWHLVPDGRQSIAMPEVKTTIVELPGASGVIDLSEVLTNYPVYNNRTGTLNFHVLNDHGNWKDRYQSIASHVHGKRVKVVLEDDPDYYYEGRVSVPEWHHNNNGTWSGIDFNYSLDPYKYYKDLQSTTLTLSSTSQTITINANWAGRMPAIPKFEITGSTGNVTIRCTNRELGISSRAKTITGDGTYTFSDIIISKISPTNSCSLSLSGSGTVVVSTRKGDL